MLFYSLFEIYARNFGLEFSHSLITTTSGNAYWVDFEGGVKNKYGYNGKEYVDHLDLRLSDYGLRYMDPAIGRWTTIDPRAEKYPDMSSYNYVGNNPIKNIDINGDTITPMGFETDYVSAKQDQSVSPQFVDPSLLVSGDSQGGFHLTSEFKEGEQYGNLPQGSDAEIIDAPVGTTKYFGNNPFSGEMVNEEGYFDGVEINIEDDDAKAVGGPEGDAVMSLVSQEFDSVSHITIKDGIPIDTQTSVAQRPKGAFTRAVTKTTLKKVPGVVKNPRE